MHELAIAQNIIEIVEKYARQNGSKAVSLVELEIGSISGIVADSLKFSMEVSVKGTILEKAKVKIRTITARAKCNECGNDFVMDDIYTFCPKCNSTQYTIIRGKEMQVKSIKIT